MMRYLLGGLVLSLVGIFARPATAQVNLIINGGFESPVIATSFVQYNAPSTAITGWSVTTNSVDIVRSPSYAVRTGSQALDLNGVAAGTISQSFATQAGAVYSLEFFYNRNGSTSRSGTVQVIGSSTLINTTVTNTTGTFQAYTGSFTANSTSTTLRFIGDSAGGSGGIILDDIRVVVMPEPASLFLFVLALPLVATQRVRRFR